MLTPEQEQLIRAADAMRRDNDSVTKFAVALVKAEADRDAYLKHLEQSQAEVTRLNEELENLRDILDQWENGVLALTPDIRADRFAAYCESRGLIMNADGSAVEKNNPGSLSATGVRTPTAEPPSESAQSVESTLQSGKSTS